MPQGRDAQDAEDIRQVLAGDPAAFRGLVARHGRRVHDLARRMLRDAHEAEDVVQHAFLNAYRALGRFDLRRPFRNWLLRIASNLCRNRLARGRTRARQLPARGGEDPLPEPPERAPPATPPSQAAARRERVRRAIEDLPERYRLPVILKYVHGCSLEEIAAISEIPVATVKTHLHRGRAALRDLLREDETAGGAGGMEE